MAGDVIETAAAGDDPIAVETVTPAQGDLLLLGLTKTDPYHIRMRGIYGADDGVFIRCGKIAVAPTGDGQSRIAAAELIGA